jgi:hypothetical protein
MLTIWNHVAKARMRSSACRGSRLARAHHEADGRLGIAIAAPDRRLRSPSTSAKKLVASLVAQHLADEIAERVDVVAQRGVLERET